MSAKPLRIFQSPLTGRFYAVQAYKEDKRGFVTVTGKKHDVTDDVRKIIEAAKAKAQGGQS